MLNKNFENYFKGAKHVVSLNSNFVIFIRVCLKDICKHVNSYC